MCEWEFFITLLLLLIKLGGKFVRIYTTLQLDYVNTETINF